jgi:serine/threonine protein kinase
MSAVSLTEGTLFAGRYQVIRRIAAGGMGAVYEVLHVETARKRALKVMHPQFLQSQEMRDRFRQEAKVAANIESEFIVDVFDAGIDEATEMPFLVMELLKGEEIGRRVTKRGRLAPSEVVTYLHQTALALDKTHKAQIVHRDLKPENLFLTERDDGLPKIKILDFGIAKVVADSGTNVNATRSLGTPLYMAPEQFRPGYRVAPTADLYALAMIAYTLLVGRTYWAEEATGGNVFSFAMVAVNGPPEPATVRAQRAGVPLPPALDAWFARAASPQPEARFPTATATVAALAEALGVPVPGLGTSGSLGLGQGTQVLGEDDLLAISGQRPAIGASQSGPVSGPYPSGSVPGVSASGSVPGMGASGSVSGMGASGSVSGMGASGSVSGMQSSGPVGGMHASGSMSGMQVSGAVAPAGAAVPGTKSKAGVIVGVSLGAVLCLAAVGGGVYFMSSGKPAAEPQAAAASPEPSPAVTAPAAVTATATATAAPTAEEAPTATVAAKPTAAPAGTTKPAVKPTGTLPKKTVHARD